MRYFFMILLVSLLLYSCKKNYTCQCTDKSSGIGTNSFTVEASSDNEAESECAASSDSTEDCFLSN